MRRPWQIWSVYAFCLAVVLPAMAWLTQQTLQADRAEWHARLSAEREETVNSVLWQMDTELTTLLAQEAARPHFVYSPFYAAPAVMLTKNQSSSELQPVKGSAPEAAWPGHRSLPSPLLLQPASYVVLHFQVDPRNVVTSPQVPLALETLAIEHGASLQNIELGKARLQAIQPRLEFSSLLALLPDQRLSESAIGQWQINSRATETQVVGNTLGFPPVQEELEAQGYGQQGVNSPAQQAQVGQDDRGDYLANNSRGQSRGGNDLQQRNRAYQSAAQRQVVEQRLNYQTSRPQLKYVSEGVSQPLWLDDRLLLARRVKVGDEELIQGCWLDWPKIRGELVERYEEMLPGLDLEPVRRETDRSQIKVSRLLATLPAQMITPAGVAPPQPWSPLRMALLVAWSMLVLASVAVALLLQGVITLSERRGAFVSAVTHELRTPLTTFRMYAEMLAENMVPEPATRQKYLETLRVEADRLSHLVENVLAYARLERGPQGQRREATTLGRLVEHAQHRFRERAAQADLELVIDERGRGDTPLNTDPAAVEQILFNLIDNACKYAATSTDRRIEISLATARGVAVVRVADHGPGIDSQGARRLFQPFSKSVHAAACSAPGVGLGLALSRRLAQQLGGRLELEPTAGGGATFALQLPMRA